jgi:amidase
MRQRDISSSKDCVGVMVVNYGMPLTFQKEIVTILPKIMVLKGQVEHPGFGQIIFPEYRGHPLHSRVYGLSLLSRGKTKIFGEACKKVEV